MFWTRNNPKLGHELRMLKTCNIAFDWHVLEFASSFSIPLQKKVFGACSFPKIIDKQTDVPWAL